MRLCIGIEVGDTIDQAQALKLRLTDLCEDGALPALSAVDIAAFLDDDGPITMTVRLPPRVREQDLRIDVYRTGIATSLVSPPPVLRITHLPTGIVITEQGASSQLQNKAKALERLEATLVEHGWFPTDQETP